ncbi:MAG: hypothetical protein ACYDBB_16380 [Armatimonadota bacterium]
MGLDIHVMRPRRLFLRNYELPVQKLLPGVEIRTIGMTPMSDFDAGVAEEALVRRVRRDQQDPRYVLPHDDEIYFSERFSYDAFDLLRKFAAYQDYPQRQFAFWGAKSFGDGYDPDTLPSLKIAWRRQTSAYPHLVLHEDNRGFYFPTTIPFPIQSDFGYLGATPRLQEELTALAKRAHQALRYRETVSGAINLLLQAAEASARSGLPIVFDG